MFSQTPTPFVLDRILGPILDGAVWAAGIVLAFMIFLALVRHGRVNAPWAKNWFLDPVDRARAKREGYDAEADGGPAAMPAHDDGAIAPKDTSGKGDGA